MNNFDLIKYLAEGKLKETFVKLSDEQKAKVIAAAKRGEAPEDVIDSDFDGDDKYLQSVKALMDKSKLNEEMFDVATTEKIAQAVADAFTAEDDLDLKYIVTPGTSERSFDLDVEAGPNTPGEDSLGQDIENYLGDYAGGSFYIKDGVVYNAAMRNAPVANVTPEGGIEMISAEDSRAALGMVDGEKTDYMERRREMSDYMEEGAYDNNYSERMAKIKQAEEDRRADKISQEEFVKIVQANINEKQENKPSNKMKKSELKEMIKAAMMAEGGNYYKDTLKEDMSIEDVYNDAKRQVKDIYNIDVPMDMVKQWADNYQFPYSREEDPNDEDNYILVYDFGTEERGDFMEWLKDNGLREGNLEESEFDTNKPARIEAFLKSLDDLVDEYHAELYLNDDLFSAIEDVKSAAKAEMGGPVDDIPGFEGTMDALDSLSIREEKKDDKEEDVEDEEIDVDLDQEEVDMDMDMDMEDRGEVGLTGDKKVVDDSLEAALEAARSLGDEKLVDQIGNTITFFTRSQIVKENINKEKILQEVKRMQRIAGIIK